MSSITISNDFTTIVKEKSSSALENSLELQGFSNRRLVRTPEYLAKLVEYAQADYSARQHVQSGAEERIDALAAEYLPRAYQVITTGSEVNVLLPLNLVGAPSDVTFPNLVLSGIMELREILRSVGISQIKFSKELNSTPGICAGERHRDGTHVFLSVTLEDESNVSLFVTHCDNDREEVLLEGAFEEVFELLRTTGPNGF